MILSVIFAMLALVVLLPFEIRVVKYAYRNAILVWAVEVYKAWTE
jgi:hypothetical protein